MKTYYAITWNLDIVCLGEHENFDSADITADGLNDGTGDAAMYICGKDELLRLRNNIEDNLV